MGAELEWRLTCCRCGKVEVEAARTLYGTVDSDPVQVKHPEAPGWHTDGLGGWMCDACYSTWDGRPVDDAVIRAT